MDFTGQVAISTGAASGMGLLFAENFAALGGNVVMCDVNENVLLPNFPMYPLMYTIGELMSI